MKKKYKMDYKKICLGFILIGFILTLIYIFRTSTAILTSDSVITDVISHEQKINKQFFLTNWYYGNEFWFFSLSIPTLLLSFISSNQILIRQVSVLITAIIFFVLLYKYGKNFLKKEETYTLIAIFATGISYSVLDYFYAFNAYLTVVINSLLLLFFYYKCFEDKNNRRIYFGFSMLFTFLFNVGSLRYFPSVVIPFIFTELFFIIRDNIDLNMKQMIKKDVRIKKMLGIVLVACLALVTYKVLTYTLHFEARASNMNYTTVKMSTIEKGSYAIIDCISNFFGYDNQDHPNVFMMTDDYFLSQHKDFSLLSIRGIAYFIKFIICILFMIITPITLFKHFKEHSKKMQFLLLFNTISWFFMIYSYLFMNNFFYQFSELKYFLTNIILNIILGVYCIYKYYISKPVIQLGFQCLFIFYIVSNLYTTASVLIEHDQKAIDRRYELVDILQENDLNFGYSGFWDGLMTYYLSNYKIEAVGVDLTDKVTPNYWYSDERWYKIGYHTGRTFLALDTNTQLYQDFYISNYGQPDDILYSEHYSILVYDKNPFDGVLEDTK